MAITGVRYDPSKAWQEGETPMGVQDWFGAFSNYNALGDGQNVNNIERMGDGTFRVWRNLAGGPDDMVQSRTFTAGPDGAVSWKGSWNTKQQESTLDQLKNAGMLAAAGVGGLGAMGFGPAAGLFGGAAGGAGASGATNAALIESAAGTAGYGASSAGLGGAAAGGAAAVADPISAYLTTGATEGSTIGNALTGAGGASGAVGSGTVASGLQGLGGLFGNNPLGTINTGRQLGGLLGGVLGGASSGGGEYNGPMPTISREGWKPSVTPQYMSLMGDVQMPKKKGNANSGLWQFLGA